MIDSVEAMLADNHDITDEGLFDLTDLLEGLAVKIRELPSGRAEKFVAARLLVDAAAAVRGAANQIYKLRSV